MGWENGIFHCSCGKTLDASKDTIHYIGAGTKECDLCNLKRNPISWFNATVEMTKWELDNQNKTGSLSKEEQVKIIQELREKKVDSKKCKAKFTPPRNIKTIATASIC